MFTPGEAYRCYPTADEVDGWLDRIWEQSETMPLTVTPVGRALHIPATHMPYAATRLLRFETPGRPAFYGVWHPPVSGPKPLMVFLPGYGAELATLPCAAGHDLAYLSLEPMGYWTPDGQREERRKEGNWPVLPDTAYSRGEDGYFQWLLNAALAVKWAWKQTAEVLPSRVSFFGTSQGGGTALLMGSLFAGRGTRCVMADEPFLTDYPVANFSGGAYDVLKWAFQQMPEEDFWHYVGLADTLCHVHRLHMPVLLSEGGRDGVCPPATIRHLYERLPATKLLYHIDGRGHGHNPEFGRLALTWADMYA